MSPSDYERTEQGDDPSGPRTDRAIIEMKFGEYTKREDELLALRARYADLDRTSEAELAACEKERDQFAARVARLEAALKETAKQTMSDEMDEDQRDDADWQFGYDACVEAARAALRDAPQ